MSCTVAFELLKDSDVPDDRKSNGVKEDWYSFDGACIGDIREVTVDDIVNLDDFGEADGGAKDIGVEDAAKDIGVEDADGVVANDDCVIINVADFSEADGGVTDIGVEDADGIVADDDCASTVDVDNTSAAIGAAKVKADGEDADGVVANKECVTCVDADDSPADIGTVKAMADSGDIVSDVAKVKAAADRGAVDADIDCDTTTNGGTAVIEVDTEGDDDTITGNADGVKVGIIEASIGAAVDALTSAALPAATLGSMLLPISNSSLLCGISGNSLSSIKETSFTKKL